jgi:predicted  nucleic acid-binding Zn-ribbon protein
MASDAETEACLDDLTGKVTVLSAEVAKVGPELDSLSKQTADLRTETRGLRQSLAEESRALRQEMLALRQALAEESRALRQEMLALRRDVGEDMQALRLELAGFRSDFSAFQRQALGLAVTLIGVLIAGVITLVIALQ